LGGFLWLIAVRTFRLAETHPERTLAAAVLAAIVGWCVASIFLHLAYFRPFAIVLALAAALAFSNGRDPDPAAAATRRRLIGVLAGVVLGVVASGLVLAATSIRTHTVSQRASLMPSEQLAALYPYVLGIRNRGVFLPTYAIVMGSGAASGVVVTADVGRG